MKKLVIHTDGVEGFWKRSLERARKLDKGEMPEPETSITLDSSALKAVTPGRLLVFQTLKNGEISVTALAELLKRPREAVSRDVQVLKSVGLVKVREVPNPGHGLRTMVSPAARQVLLEL